MNQNLVIYVDDDLDDIEMMQELFSEHTEFDLMTFSDPEQFFPYLCDHTERVCLVVLDVNMPRRGGFELLQELRGHEPTQTVPALLLSTAKTENLEARAAQLGSQLRKKPTTFEEIRSVVQDIVKQC